MTSRDYEDMCSLINSKYQLSVSKDIDAYDFVLNNSARVLQLPTVTKLLTDNQALIEDFPIDFDSFGMEPYNDYVIKVCDTFETVLYIFVHCRGNHTYLFPIVSGFETGISCSPLNLTDNSRVRMLRSMDDYEMPTMNFRKQVGLLEGFEFRESLRDLHYDIIKISSAEKEFGFPGIMIDVNTEGVYNRSLVLTKPVINTLLSVWKKSEYESLHDKYVMATFSSVALVLQVWLHTVIMWRKRCSNRKIKIVYSHGKTEYTGDAKTISSISKQTIVDLKKDVVVYVNDSLTKREFRGYHVTESERCGHFRHLADGRVIYIAPTTVHYKKLVLDERLVGPGKNTLIYRNTEDFLREKSYLEDEVNYMLRGKGITREREKMFDWMGKKRLDFYLPDKNIAIECQGVQHFYPYGAKDTDFQARRQRDIDKYNECMAHEISMIYYVNPDIPIPEELSTKYCYVADLAELYKLIEAKR